MAVDPFLAEIAIYAFTFAPKDWARCNGQLIPISQNTALFALLGTTYGGNGVSTFALPYLVDSVPMHPDNTNQFPLGATGGSETVTLLQTEIPLHSHTLQGRNDSGEERTPENATFAKATGGQIYGPDTGPKVNMAVQALPPAGGDLPHNNMMPFVTFNFCIALIGVFPPRD